MTEPVETTIVFGTAGHIDHGKTTLIKALSGVDCDRLSEEKRRGITIELGFAPLTLPSGRIVSVVDVPGHERFIRQMVAGATGIDAVILVISADEGVMPQSREHLEILSLLGIKEGLIAITKADLVDEEMLELVKSDVEDLVKGTFLEGKPMVCVSSTKGTNLDRLLEVIDGTVDRIKPRDTDGPFFMPIDRSFPIAGFGTVVTGTVYKGKTQIGDTLDVLPLGKNSKVRSIQVHGKAVQEALAGQRSALNLPNIKSTELERGDVACSSGLFKTTQCLDVKLTLLASTPEPLKHWQQVHLHIGTSETMARVALLKDTKLLPNDEAFGQLVLKEPIVAHMGQRFILRAHTHLRTIGGGEILFPYDKKPRGKKARTELLAFLDKLAQAKAPAERFAVILERIGLLPFNEAIILSQLTPEQLKLTLNKAGALGIIFIESGEQPLLMSLPYYEGLTRSLQDILNRFHEKNSHLAGMKASDLIAALEISLTKRQSQELLRLFVNRGLIETDGEIVRLPGTSPVLDEDMLKDKDKLLSYCENKGFQFPSLEEAIKELNWDKNRMNRTLDVAKQQGEIRIIGGEFLLSKRIEEKALNILHTLPEITIASMRNTTNVSRKYILSLLEDFDARGITRRIGDKRVLLKKTQ